MDFDRLLKVNNVNIKRTSDIEGLFRKPEVLLFLPNRDGDKAEIIFDLLMDPIIRRGDGIIYSGTQLEYKGKISKFISRSDPIQFVFQGFPFKCHNPVETMRRTPDLGEVAFLQRLADIDETIRQVYSPGAKFTIVTEGKSYKDLFGATGAEVEMFEQTCKRFSDRLRIRSTIEFISLLDLIKNKKGFFEACREETDFIFDACSKGKVDEVEQLIPVMMRSLPIVSKVPFEDLFAVFGFGSGSGNLTGFQKEFGAFLKEAAKELAAKYLAIQKVKRKFDVINNAFPDYLYVSTTSKKDRYSFHPIHRKTRLYPHHGVPVLGPDRVDVVYLGEIISNPSIYTAVYYDGDLENAPFYFLKGKQHIKK